MPDQARHDDRKAIACVSYDTAGFAEKTTWLCNMQKVLNVLIFE
jgi:hypothetical protein